MSADRWGEYTIERQPEHEPTVEFKKLLVEGASELDTDRPEVPPDENNSASYAIKLPAEIGTMDETVLHSIMLQPYIDSMERLIHDISNSNDIDDFNPPVIPPVPERPPTIQRIPMAPLNKENAKYLLRKSCATIVCHVGYSSAKTSALDTLTDVADDFLRRLVDRIRTAVEQTSRAGPSAFAYPLFRGLNEMGVEPLALQNYYNVEVLKHNATLYKSAQVLHKQCAALVRLKIRDRIRELQERGEEEEEDIPELHFPALGEDQLQSSLEPGFQMLDSLEHDESLQNMEADEEIVVNDSPSRDYVHSTSSDFSSPSESLSRVKRRKLV